MRWANPQASVVAFDPREIVRVKGPDGILREERYSPTQLH